MDDASRLRRKNTTKGPPLRVLSLDGGGVRGYSMLIILQELMHRTFVEIEGRAPKRHEIPRPCDHFDLIAGTGTGGLIAIMLGRLRLDLDTCKDLYVRLTRRVFETDKTFAGIPLKSTMFKASKLEEVIKEVVREHTLSEREGNDTLANATPMSPDVSTVSGAGSPRRTLSQSSRYSLVGMSPINQRQSYGSLQFGNPNSLLYDSRGNRTKTAVTAALRGTPVTTLLRSYDSRREPAPEVNCTIWEAGRATSAIALAFKPIQIGQSVYLDEGAGKYNPSPLVLDEAVVNEWPDRELGVFVSVGTGKRPSGSGKAQAEWWEGFLGGTMGEFAEARRRLIAKLEACEETHEYMRREHLASRGVNPESYYRLNVEVGVGEFGMNEWARLSEVSTSTRIYLARQEIENVNDSAARKMAKIHLAKARHDHDKAQRGGSADGHQQQNGWQNPWDRPVPTAAPPSNNIAVELPGDDMYLQSQSFRPGSQHNQHRPSVADQKYVVVQQDDYPPPSSIHVHSQNSPQRATPPAQQQQQQQQQQPLYQSPGSLHYNSSLQGQRHYQDDPRKSDSSVHNQSSPRQSSDAFNGTSTAPPLPPKTPISAAGSMHYPNQLFSPLSPNSRDDSGPRTFMNMGDLGRRLPYPDVDGPAPAVNTASKPQMPK